MSKQGAPWSLTYGFAACTVIAVLWMWMQSVEHREELAQYERDMQRLVELTDEYNAQLRVVERLRAVSKMETTWIEPEISRRLSNDYLRCAFLG